MRRKEECNWSFFQASAAEAFVRLREPTSVICRAADDGEDFRLLP